MHIIEVEVACIIIDYSFQTLYLKAYSQYKNEYVFFGHAIFCIMMTLSIFVRLIPVKSIGGDI